MAGRFPLALHQPVPRRAFLQATALAGFTFLFTSCAPEPKPAAPDVTAQTLQGQTWKLSENLGKGPIILNFFATW